MTNLLTLFIYIMLGALLGWPCWLALRRALNQRRPLRCVQPYQPQLRSVSQATPVTLPLAD